MINNFFLRLKLSSRDPLVRLNALEKLAPSEADTIFELARTDQDLNVRRTAIAKIDNPERLEQLWENETDPELKKHLRERLNRRYAAQLTDGHQIPERFLQRIQDELLLITITCTSSSPGIRAQIAALIKSNSGLVKVFHNLHDIPLGIKLLHRFDQDAEMLREIACSAAEAELKNLADTQLKLLEPDKEPEVPAEASPTPADNPEEAAPVSGGIGDELKKKLHAFEEVIDEVKRLTGYIGEDTLERLEQLKQRWHELPEAASNFMEILNRDFQQACQNFLLGIETARQSQTERLQRIDRLDEICAEAARWLAASERPLTREQFNKLTKQWDNISEGLSAIEPLQQRFQELSQGLEAKIVEREQFCHQVLTEMEKILVELKNQKELAEPDITRERRIELEKQIMEKANSLKGHHRAENLRTEFIALNRELRTKLHDLYQARDFAKWENYTLKIDLCVKAEKLLENQNLHEVSREFKEVRNHWKNIGMVPPEKIEEINTRFHTVADELNRRCTAFFDELNQKKDEIAVAKTALCEEAESLQYSTDWETASDRFKAMQKEWRELGYARVEKEGPLQERFHQACDCFFSARKVYLAEVQQSRENAAAAKRQLCDEAAALVKERPGEVSRQVKMLWERWREIGSAGREDKVLYDQFKGIFDEFYESKRNERGDNLAAKQQICTELEQLDTQFQPDAEPGKIEELRRRYKDYQQQWNNVGSVPRDNEAELFSRYNRVLSELRRRFAEYRCNREQKILNQMQQQALIIGQLMENGEIDQAKEAMAQLSDCPRELDWMTGIFSRCLTAAEHQDETFYRSFRERQQAAEKEMKSVCADLERLTGNDANSEPVISSDLAADLSAAIKNNFAAGSFRNSPLDELKELRHRWYRSGIPTTAELPLLFERYRQALVAADKQYNRDSEKGTEQ